LVIGPEDLAANVALLKNALFSIEAPPAAERIVGCPETTPKHGGSLPSS
jgi:hypothetical protein